MASPNSQKLIKEAINPSSSSTIIPSSVPKILFSSSNDQPASSSTTDYGFGTHPFIIQLAQNKVHIPLSLFTTYSMNKLHKESTSIKQNVVYNSAGTKCHIMDLSLFPDETKMDIADWHEAWNRYHTFVDTHYNTIGSKRWRDHYIFLSKQDNFRLNFPTILKFDIEQRTCYALDPKEYSEELYLRRFEAIKLELIQEEIRTDREAIRNVGVNRPMGSRSHQFEPYDRDTNARRINRKDTGNQSSFREGKGGDTGSSQPPLCLCCKRPSHKFSDCTEEKTAAGVQTLARYLGNKLVLRASSTPLCITFQLNSPRRTCKQNHPEQHICSFCGSAEHPACSRKCL